MGAGHMARHIFVIACVLAQLTACALFEGADFADLKFISIQVVDQNGPPDRRGADEQLIRGRPYLAIRVSTEQDLGEYAKQHEFNITNSVAACKGNQLDQKIELQNDPYVYDSYGKVDAFRSTPPKAAGERQGRSTYVIYAAVQATPLAGRDVFLYDLQKNPQDICFQLQGGNMSGGTFVSNVVSIPKVALIEALEHR
jgi:hypothetical protein